MTDKALDEKLRVAFDAAMADRETPASDFVFNFGRRCYRLAQSQEPSPEYAGLVERLHDQAEWVGYPKSDLLKDAAAVITKLSQAREVTDAMVERSLPYWENELGTSRQIVRAALEAAIKGDPNG